MQTLDTYLELYQDMRETLTGDDPSSMEGLRDRALESLQRQGIPGRRSEGYKYTQLENMFAAELLKEFRPREIDFNGEELFRCDVPMLDANVLMVLNGFFYDPDGKELYEHANGLIYGSLRAAKQKYPELVAKKLSELAEMDKDAFVAMNTAFYQDGIFLHVPDGAQMEKPIQIIHLLLSEESRLVQHRNLFLIGKNAAAQVIICDHTLSPQHFLTNSVTEVYAGENSDTDILRLQNEHNNSGQVTNTWIRQQAYSRCSHSTITLHGGVVRNNLRMQLRGEGAESEALGLFLTDKMQHVDNYTVIDHAAPHCTSNQYYKGVLDDASTGAFSGKIHVFPDAQKTEAFQTNNNILLTDSARMNTKPRLEIYADDVKCSHGSTVGQLDEDAMFYMQSRGIPRDESRLMLMDAFTYDVISRIKQTALRERISDLVRQRLRGELSRCNSCALHCEDPDHAS